MHSKPSSSRIVVNYLSRLSLSSTNLCIKRSFPSLSPTSKIRPIHTSTKQRYTKINMTDAIHNNLHFMRKEYTDGTLSEDQLPPEPFTHFTTWFEWAKANFPWNEANGMTLSTVGSDGRPSSRVVLLKEFGPESGFVFFTNYESKKGKQMSENPFVALNFWWDQRQIRVEGIVERVDAAVSDKYYDTRPVGSRIGAWISKQSQPIAGREVLDNEVKKLESKYNLTMNEQGVGTPADPDHPVRIPRPPFWGGYRVIPYYIEFWQGRKSRLHDRIVYERDWKRDEDGAVVVGESWKMSRLAP